MATGKKYIHTYGKNFYPWDEKMNKLTQPINVCETFLFGVSDSAARTVTTTVSTMDSWMFYQDIKIMRWRTCSEHMFRARVWQTDRLQIFEIPYYSAVFVFFKHVSFI
jgi:hypothetical protein